MNAVWQHKKEAYDAEVASKKGVEKQIAELEASIKKLEGQLAKEREEAARLEENASKANNTFLGTALQPYYEIPCDL